jgi:hypothetical protein
LTGGNDSDDDWFWTGTGDWADRRGPELIY